MARQLTHIEISACPPDCWTHDSSYVYCVWNGISARKMQRCGVAKLLGKHTLCPHRQAIWCNAGLSSCGQEAVEKKADRGAPGLPDYQLGRRLKQTAKIFPVWRFRRHRIASSDLETAGNYEQPRTLDCNLACWPAPRSGAYLIR